MNPEMNLIEGIYAEKELLQMLMLGVMEKIADEKAIVTVDEDTTMIYMAFANPTVDVGENPASFAMMRKEITVADGVTYISLQFANGRLKYENALANMTTVTYTTRKFLH